MKQLWFCLKCRIEGSLDFASVVDVWAVVDAVRRDHIEKSGDCARVHGVNGIRLRMDVVDDAEYEQMKREVAS